MWALIIYFSAICEDVFLLLVGAIVSIFGFGPSDLFE